MVIQWSGHSTGLIVFAGIELRLRAKNGYQQEPTWTDKKYIYSILISIAFWMQNTTQLLM